MYLISAEGYKNANVAFLTIKTTNEIWVSMKDVGNPSKEQVNEHKMTKKQI